MKKYVVTLAVEQRERLCRLIGSGYAPARQLAHARILLQADSSPGQPNWPDQQISEALCISLSTIHRVRRCFTQEGLDAALNPREARNPRPRRLDGVQEAHLIALACSQAPKGYQRWTLRLLADRMVQLGYSDRVSYETVRRTLKKTNSSRG